MCFARENRDAISQEVGATDTSTLSKVIGERWGEVTDRSRWERQAADDRVRHDREMATYQAGLNAEDAAEKARIASAASGPSDRELERAEKRQRLQEEVEERAAAPKKERKAKVLTQAEQTLAAQNKEIESDKACAARSGRTRHPVFLMLCAPCRFRPSRPSSGSTSCSGSRTCSSTLALPRRRTRRSRRGTGSARPRRRRTRR